jgi:hypothetical protein
MKNPKFKRKQKCLIIRLSCPFLIWKKIPQNISELPRPYGPPPIRRWSSSSSGTNILKRNSKGFMMQPLMGGSPQISTDVVIRRDGRWLLLKQNQIVLYLAVASSLEASQQLNGNHRGFFSIKPTPIRSFSVLMKAANTLSLGITEMLLNVTEVSVHCLGQVVVS